VTEFRVALTFDAEHPDRPATDGNADRLLDELDRLAVRSTFFLQGRWVEGYPATARRVVAAGHLVGSHSHYHIRMPLLSADGLTTDVADAELAILEHAGIDPKPWFRCPFGSGSDDADLVGRLATLGYREVGWNVSGDDWEPANSPADVADAVVAATIERGDGAVILHHTWPDQTLAAMPAIVRRLRDAGASFVALDGLDELPGLGLPVESQIVGER
jgi:peptidoglycan/xylan/chitin deacetylase (PgdA/CDA1 family)